MKHNANKINSGLSSTGLRHPAQAARGLPSLWLASQGRCTADSPDDWGVSPQTACKVPTARSKYTALHVKSSESISVMEDYTLKWFKQFFPFISC